MLIDINTYVGHWPFRNLRYNTLEGLDTLAQRYDVTHMIVANINGFFYKDANTANLELLEELKAYKGKTQFLPMAIINPTYPAWEKDARDMIAAGFAGFELAPIYHGYSMAPEMPYDSYYPVHYALKVLDLAEELDVPVRICASIENFRGRSQLDNFNNITGEDYFALLSKNKNVHVFCTSFAPAAAGEHFSALLKERKNTYFDTTQFGVMTLAGGKPAMKVISDEQICFGSLSPFFYMEAALIRTNYCPEFDFEKVRINPARAFKSLR